MGQLSRMPTQWKITETLTFMMLQYLQMQGYVILWNIWNYLRYLPSMAILKMLFFWHVTWKEFFHQLPSSAMNKLCSFISTDTQQEWTKSKLILKVDLPHVILVTVRSFIHLFTQNFSIKDYQKAKPKFGWLIQGNFVWYFRWTSGRYGIGKRISSSDSVKIINAIN